MDSNSNLTPLLSELFAMTFHAGIKPGLERIEQLCASIDHPEACLPVIHVAGTNGKGSTSAMLASILQHAGYRVGLYTSPHIVQFNERIRINGTMISDDDILRLARPLMDLAQNIGGTFFEVTTAMALAYFAEHRVDVAVIETGLGGRLDATNVVTPLVSVITGIDYDHMEYLGTTLPQIAGEKAGIIKQGAPAVLGPLLAVGDVAEATAVRRVFTTAAERAGTTLTYAPDVVRVEVDRITPDLTMVASVLMDDALQYFDVELAGAHQAANIATVMATLPALRSIFFVTEDHISNGLRTIRATTGTTGRIHLLRRDPVVVVDVSHNPGGIESLITTVRAAGYSDHTWQVVFGAMRDKDVAGMLRALAPAVDTLHLCAPALQRALDTNALELFAIEAGMSSVLSHTSVAQAVLAAEQQGPTLICGSFHVADEALRSFAP